MGRSALEQNSAHFELTMLSARSEITYSGALPAGVSKEKVLSVLHDHVAYFKAAEHYREHKELPDEGSLDKVPSEIQSRHVDGASGLVVKAYTVRNEVPNPVFDSNVETTYFMVNLADGLWYHAASPMGVINEGLWEVKEGAGGLELLVTIQVECNMVLKPIVKGQVKTSAEQIHKALVGIMKD